MEDKNSCHCEMFGKRKLGIYLLVWFAFAVITAITLFSRQGKIGDLIFAEGTRLFADSLVVYEILDADNIYTGDDKFVQGCYGLEIGRCLRDYPPMSYLHFAIAKRLLHSWNITLYVTCYLILLVTVLLLYLFYHHLTVNEWGKVLFCISYLFSSVFICSMERGNIINLVAVYVTFYLFFYDSKNKILQQLAFFALALAISMKIYPALLGFLLLQRRDWRGCACLYIYSFLCCLLPFFCFEGGIANVRELMRNIFARGNFLHPAIALFEGYPNLLQKIGGGRALSVGFCILGMALSFADKKKWRKCLLLIFGLLLLPQVGAWYNLLYLFPGFVLFFNSEEDGLENCLLSAVFAIVISPILLPCCGDFSGKITHFAVDMMILLCIWGSGRDFFNRWKDKKKKQNAAHAN